MAWKILLPQEIMSEGRKLLEDAGHTIIEGRGFETEDVLADMKEHQPDAMIVRITPITREVIEANPNLKVIVRHGAGFDALDVKACHDNGVQTLYAPVANSTSVAETAMLLILECSRNVTLLHKTWVDDYYKAKLKLRKNTLNGKTLGLIGCGNIGSRLAVRALAMEMNVLAYDPYKPAADFPDGVEVVRDLDRIFKESDYVSLHTPNTPVTKNLVDKNRLAMMKPTAFLIICKSPAGPASMAEMSWGRPLPLAKQLKILIHDDRIVKERIKRIERIDKRTGEEEHGIR